MHTGPSFQQPPASRTKSVPSDQGPPQNWGASETSPDRDIVRFLWNLPMYNQTLLRKGAAPGFRTVGSGIPRGALPESRQSPRASGTSPDQNIGRFLWNSPVYNQNLLRKGAAQGFRTLGSRIRRRVRPNPRVQSPGTSLDRDTATSYTALTGHNSGTELPRGSRLFNKN